MNSVINWERVSTAVTHYRQLGFQYVEAPWVVSEQAVRYTLPSDRKGLRCEDGPLVGSAEQSFIQLWMEGFFDRNPQRRFVAATPCFRDDVIDKIHQRYFFKVELLEVVDGLNVEATARLEEMIGWARRLFDVMSPARTEIETIKTKSGFDININGIEVGSYGVRSIQGERGTFSWVYGTGLAEPRFSQAVAILRKS